VSDVDHQVKVCGWIDTSAHRLPRSFQSLRGDSPGRLARHQAQIQSIKTATILALAAAVNNATLVLRHVSGIIGRTIAFLPRHSHAIDKFDTLHSINERVLLSHSML